MFDSISVERQLAEQITNRLPQSIIKSRSPFQSNFRCIVCGDSAQNKRKKRGFLLEKREKIHYYCHNCNYSNSLRQFCKEYHSDLYRQYAFQLLQHKFDPVEIDNDQPVALTDKYLDQLINLVDLPDNHLAVQYVKSRMIPDNQFNRIYFIDKFCQYVNHHTDKNFPTSPEYEHCRLVFPMINSSKQVFGVIARSFDPNAKQRYITIKFDSSADKIFGLDRLDLRKYGYVFEGPIDSLFVDNSIAYGGTQGNIDKWFPNKNRYTIVLDNQPRNKQLVALYNKYIAAGSTIVIWPHHITSKDVNQMVLDGLPVDKVQQLIDENSFNGLTAKVKLSNWSKV